MNTEATPLPSLALCKTYLNNAKEVIELVGNFDIAGRITRVTGLVIEAVGLKLPMGSACIIALQNGEEINAEIVGFDNEKVFLMPQNSVEGLLPGTPVFAAKATDSICPVNLTIRPSRRAVDRTRHLPVGYELLGRVLDGAGKPLDSLGPLNTTQSAALKSRSINPLHRAPITEILDVGVRAINSMLTIGRGQRMGLFAGSGVGKSVLLGMMARYTSADVIVVGLIGERGREVKEFIEQILGAQGLARSVVVAAPADTPPLMRLQGAAYATTIAEFFRDQGKSVLLIMDSLTRYAMAQREIALAIGEPPATKGYPPSVFAKLPLLVERAGNSLPGGGSITAFYTVLTEGDDQQDPIADAARAILDGHIVLDRTLADSGHYPAIDIEQSISRAMTNIASPSHQKAARKLKQLVSRYQHSRDLISVGAYSAGTDPVLDEAILNHLKIEHFLQQGIQERSSITESLGQLTTLF
ncbi:flagellar protein export ATPase FliI [Solimicrobium silvestre]|uniref:Flagellum-specific ATP synthase n=1 Tax=Solimicrobium silvestre TaxID=2099400 RepID=A0A2S9GSU0_9BURK|nr:flagellar protein export ATPase FliI [Solimicrobium silvestre]PRC90780.1 Flagellar protein export ATPase FliI [Solimicrobium silvestre]